MQVVFLAFLPSINQYSVMSTCSYVLDDQAQITAQVFDVRLEAS